MKDFNLPFAIEWQGGYVTVFLTREELDDLDHVRDSQPDKEYVASFDSHIASIFNTVVAKLKNEKPEDGRIQLTSKDFPELWPPRATKFH